MSRRGGDLRPEIIARRPGSIVTAEASKTAVVNDKYGINGDGMSSRLTSCRLNKHVKVSYNYLDRTRLDATITSHVSILGRHMAAPRGSASIDPLFTH